MEPIRTLPPILLFWQIIPINHGLQNLETMLFPIELLAGMMGEP